MYDRELYKQIVNGKEGPHERFSTGDLVVFSPLAHRKLFSLQGDSRIDRDIHRQDVYEVVNIEGTESEFSVRVRNPIDGFHDWKITLSHLYFMKVGKVDVRGNYEEEGGS